jgi:hypothetical protein
VAKVILTILATTIGLIAYYPYVRDVLKAVTKPHAFSWLIWALLESIAFFAQLSKGGGIGALVTGASALVVLFIAIQSLRSKDKDITLFDWLAFAGAIIGLLLWRLTDDALFAVILVSVTDALAFLPTFRKTFYRPNEETLSEYGLSAVKWLIGIFALQTLNLTTWLYPASLVLTNSTFVIMGLIRKNKLRN